jgi:predicted enzyme related to lactoylglutathione lyase
MALRHKQQPRPRLCYLEIPALDVHQSAAFYEKVFGWDIRGRDTCRPSFSYPSADVTGAWVTGRAISQTPGLLPYIWVDHIDDTLARIESCGGQVVEAPHLIAREGEWIALFRDPAGNVMGLYQEGPR